MARKTDGERITDLERLVWTLLERVDHIQDEMIKPREFAEVKTRLEELKERVDKAGNRGWTIILALFAAVIGSCLTLIVQLALAHLVGRN
jgi:hypothetical protein